MAVARGGRGAHFPLFVGYLRRQRGGWMEIRDGWAVGLGRVRVCTQMKLIVNGRWRRGIGRDRSFERVNGVCLSVIC